MDKFLSFSSFSFFLCCCCCCCFNHVWLKFLASGPWYTVDMFTFNHLWLGSSILTMVHCGQVFNLIMPGWCSNPLIVVHCGETFLLSCLPQVPSLVFGWPFLFLDLGNSLLWFHSVCFYDFVLIIASSFVPWSLRLGLWSFSRVCGHDSSSLSFTDN